MTLAEGQRLTFAGMTLVIALLGCSRGPAAQRDTAASGRSSTSPVVPAAATPAAMAVPPDVRAVCDSVYASWRRYPQAKVARADSSISRQPTDDEWGTKTETSPVIACVVRVMTDTALDSVSRARTYWKAVPWPEILRSRADGPDGTSFTVQRAAVRCEISISVDGGDDSDSTYKSLPFEGEDSRCYRAPRALVARDTMYDVPD